MNYIQSILLGIIEGITEFLPVSSTGHMILLSHIMGIIENKITNLFIVSIQFGAILSIFFLYRKKIFYRKKNFYFKIFIANLPVCILGLIFYKKINILLKNPLIVSLSLLIGGIIILISEKFYKKKFSINKKNKNCITYYRALIIGLFQCISLIPGTSRSATTIVSGLIQKIDRKELVEFSFFLSIPIISIASFEKIINYCLTSINSKLFLYEYDIKILLLGNISAFITSIISVKFFIGYIKNNSFKLFGYYRIFLGSLFIITHYFF